MITMYTHTGWAWWQQFRSEQRNQNSPHPPTTTPFHPKFPLASLLRQLTTNQTPFKNVKATGNVEAGQEMYTKQKNTYVQARSRDSRRQRKPWKIANGSLSQAVRMQRPRAAPPLTTAADLPSLSLIQIYMYIQAPQPHACAVNQSKAGTTIWTDLSRTTITTVMQPESPVWMCFHPSSIYSLTDGALKVSYFD